jgi:hypothetical protein
MAFCIRPIYNGNTLLDTDWMAGIRFPAGTRFLPSPTFPEHHQGLSMFISIRYHC